MTAQEFYKAYRDCIINKGMSLEETAKVLGFDSVMALRKAYALARFIVVGTGK